MAGAAICSSPPGSLLSRPYVRVADEHPGAQRTPADGGGVLRPAVDLPRRSRREPGLGGGHLAAARRPGEHPGEDPVPGARDRRPGDRGPRLAAPTRAGLRRGLGVGVRRRSSVLALGFQGEGGLLWPYRVVYELLPGWEAIRVPGRLVTFSSLGLGAAGRRRARSGLTAGRTRPGSWRRWGGAAAIAAAARCWRSWSRAGASLRPVRQPGPARGAPGAAVRRARVAAPQLHLPAERPSDNRRYLLWSTDGVPGDGQRSLEPQSGLHGAPDRATSRRSPTGARSRSCRGSGCSSVVLHANRVQRHPVGGAARSAGRRPRG